MADIRFEGETCPCAAKASERRPLLLIGGEANIRVKEWGRHDGKQYEHILPGSHWEKIRVYHAE